MGIGGRASDRRAPHPRGLVPALVATVVLSCCQPAGAAEPEAQKSVVVLYPHESDGAPGITLVNGGIRSTFAGHSPGRVELRNEYVDTTRLRDADFMRAQVALLRQKYAGRKVDLVIAGLSAGLDFALAIREEVFPGVPIVFVLVDEREVRTRRLPPDIPGQSIIYYLHIFRDGTGRSFVPAEALERLAARANAPVYSHVDTLIERGAVGGHAYLHETEGKIAARLGLRILSGEKAETIPASGMSENTYLFNWRQLRRWGIGEGNLPPGSVVRHREPSFWDLYRWHVVGVVSLCVAEALLIAGLLFQRARLRRSGAALRESEARFRLMADAAPVLVWTSGVDKRCTYFNRPWLEFTGRPLGRELGDGWADGVHPDDLARCVEVYTTHFDRREPFEMVYRLRRHDGEYRWVLDRGVARLSPDGAFAGYIGACADITERRLAEDGLRASQRELQLLTGRLLEAQEAERRRVARELHDDVNQTLALLSVEIDLLGQRPPASPAEVARHMRELSGRVKEVSSAVHDLSHQLHPSRLEQLGLVAAVRGLCKELRQHHGLEATFTHREVPEEVPEATALCLYRIVQEALRNVVKHGGTDHAAVELTGTPGGIRLRVSDGGAGFDPASANGGLGLVGMRERLHLVGGEIAIDSRPAGGTRIDVRVPAPPPDRPEGALEAELARG